MATAGTGSADWIICCGGAISMSEVAHGVCAPSPRLRGEGRGEGGCSKLRTAEAAPHPTSSLTRGCRPLPASGERLAALQNSLQPDDHALIAAQVELAIE